MLVKRLVVTLLILGLIAIGIMKPAPAVADTTTDLELALGAAGIWVAIVIVGTTLAYGPPFSTTLAESRDLIPNRPEPSSTVHFGPQCPRNPIGGPPSLLCW